MIQSQLSRLLGERRINLSELQRQTGLHYTSLHALYHDKAKRVDLATLDAICSALGVGVGELLEHVPGSATT